MKIITLDIIEIKTEKAPGSNCEISLTRHIQKTQNRHGGTETFSTYEVTETAGDNFEYFKEHETKTEALGEYNKRLPAFKERNRGLIL
jgi:hypothetical protein